MKGRFTKVILYVKSEKELLDIHTKAITNLNKSIEQNEVAKLVNQYQIDNKEKSIAYLEKQLEDTSISEDERFNFSLFSLM